MTGGGRQDSGDPYAYDDVSPKPAAHPIPSPGVSSKPEAPAPQAPAEPPSAAANAARAAGPRTSGRGGAIWAVSLAVVGLLMGSMFTDVPPFALIRPVPGPVSIFIIVTAALVGFVVVVRPGARWRIRVTGALVLLIAGWAVVPPLVTATPVSRQLAAESAALGGKLNHATIGDEVQIGDWFVTIDLVNRDASDWYLAAFPD